MLVNVRQNWNIISRETKGVILGIAAPAATLGVTFGAAAVLHDLTGRANARGQTPASSVSAPLSAQIVRGQSLFSQECASCHGDHAQGGFGPDLHRLEMPDTQVASTIKDGVKPEMPAFGRNLNEPAIKALTAYVHSMQK